MHSDRAWLVIGAVGVPVLLLAWLLPATALASAAPLAADSAGSVVHAPAGSAALQGRSRLAFTGAYFGELLLHPGTVAEIEGRVAGGCWGALLLAGQLGSYVHVRNHVGVFAAPEVGYRLAFTNGYQLETFAGLGYLHTFLGAPVYEVDPEGHVREVFDAGRPHVMPTFALATAWRVGQVAPLLRVQAFGEYPFNRHLLLHLALVLGLRVWID